MDVALSGQWSGMPSFSLIIYSYNCLFNFDLIFSKSIKEMYEFYFLANWWMDVALSGHDQVCSFSLIIYSYFSIKVFIA